MTSAFVPYWKVKNTHSEIMFWLQHLVLLAYWSWMQRNDVNCLILYSYPANEAVLSKSWHLTWKAKQDPSHLSSQTSSVMQSSSCVAELCSKFSDLFFFLIAPYALRDGAVGNKNQQLENVHNLENDLEHSVWKKTGAKCEGVSFPSGGSDFVVCSHTEHFSKIINRMTEYPESEGALKSHWVQLWAPHSTTLNPNTMHESVARRLVEPHQLGAVPLPWGACLMPFTLWWRTFS